MSTTTEQDTRRINRIGLTLPVRVDYKVTPDIAFNEITRLIDVSAFGAGFNLPRPIKRGRLVLLTIPMPRQLRSYDFTEPQYRIWGLVRHCIPLRRGEDVSYSIGVAFIGKNPPVGYMDNPSRLYDVTERNGESFWQIAEAPENPDESHLPKEYRRHSRHPIPVSIMLELLGDGGETLAGEMTVTENISLSGASVFTNIKTPVGTFVRITSDQYNASITAIVRGKRSGQDGFPRLHLEFVDHYFPLEGID